MEVTVASGTLRLRLQDEAPENSCRPSGDLLFRSVARAFGASANISQTGSARSNSSKSSRVNSLSAPSPSSGSSESMKSAL